MPGQNRQADLELFFPFVYTEMRVFSDFVGHGKRRKKSRVVVRYQYFL